MSRERPRSGGVVRSLAGLALALARQWRPQVAALMAACGVVAATITGALGVGAGVRRGLESLALDRLGGIEAALFTDGSFTPRLVADAIAAWRAAGGGDRSAVAAFVAEVTVEATGERGGSLRATLLACDGLADLGFLTGRLPTEPVSGAAVNEPLAAALGLRAGDAVVVRVPRRSEVPADSPLGRRDAQATGRRLAITGVLPDRGLGRFAVRPTQVTAPLVVTSLATARAMLRRDDVVNVVFGVGRGDRTAAATTAWADLRPSLADLGLAIEPVAGASVLRLVSRSLILAPEVDRAAEVVLGPLGARRSLAFLANSLTPVDAAGASAEAGVPYSTVLGVDSTSLAVGDLVDSDGRILDVPADDEILIDRWMADDLAAQGRPVAVGDRIELKFFGPETLHGTVVEQAATLRVCGVAEMVGAAIARELVPEVEGITDEESIADWDPPFPFDPSRVRTTPPHDEDDRFWKMYRATPKAFVSLATAERLAGGRFGRSTAWHLAAVADASAVADRLAAEIDPAQAGIRVATLRGEALDASRGSTPFGGLFLALSSFVVLAGLLLEWLLVRLLVAAHHRDLGLLAAVGWPPLRLAALLTAVGGVAAAGGAVVGAVLGPPWAWLLRGQLSRAWASDVSAGSQAAFAAAPFEWAPIVQGAVAAAAVSLVAVAWAAWRAARRPPLALLRGGEAAAATSSGRPRTLAAVALLVASAAAAWLGRDAAAATAVACFFGAGAGMLAGCLLAARDWLVAGRPRHAVRTLSQLAGRGLAQRPARSLAVATIVAVAQFLIVAVSSFALRPPPDPDDRGSATGGWTFIATFGAATSLDPRDPAMQERLGLAPAAAAALASCDVALVRSSTGDDASCTNLYATRQPPILGIGAGFIRRGGFRFVAHAGPAGADGSGGWNLLERSGDDGPVPAVLDQATAQWALKLGGLGARFTLPDDGGRAVEFEIVGLLEPGILQGFVIVAEREFERLFPTRSGYGMALVDATTVEPAARSGLSAALRDAWADASVSVTPALERLRGIQAVQNTFLAGFQSLGMLGLLLGTAGVAAIQAQGTAERLGALAALRAIGFTLPRIRMLLVGETLLIVGLGLAIGTAAGCLAVAPMLGAGLGRLPLTRMLLTAALTLAAACAAGAATASRTTVPERPRCE